MRIEVHTVNAFIDGADGGNSAGVVADANALTGAQKLQLAQRIGLSETAFVSASQSATVKLEFFTPTRQIAHCGHATIATFALLRQLHVVDDGVLSKETIDGHRTVIVEGDLVFMEQLAPRYTRVDPGSVLEARVIASLGLQNGSALAGAAQVVDTGNAFLIVALPDERAVRELRPDLERVHSISDELDLIGYYVFSRDTQLPGRHAGTRMFAPRFGIDEEAATGMAAGPLACLLHDHFEVEDTQLQIEQGWLMQPPSPSVITVDLDVSDGNIKRLMAGGSARRVSSQWFEV
jgi:PhzF family phenazine biosynthesis protein